MNLTSHWLTLHWPGKRNLRSGHGLHDPFGVVPTDEGYQEQRGDGGKVPSVKEGEGDAEKASSQTEVYNEEESKEYIDRFWTFLLLLSREWPSCPKYTHDSVFQSSIVALAC